MTNAQLSLLMYLEECAVNAEGRVDNRRINDQDREQIKTWTKTGLIRSGRIAFEDCTRDGSTWVQLTEYALEIVYAARRDRIRRFWQKKTYKTTDEKRGD